MKRKCYYLPEWLLYNLEKFAAKKGKPMSEIVRAAIEAYLTKNSKG